MFSGNLQGGSDEEADGTMHCARSFRGVRNSDFVALVAEDNAFSAVDSADARVGRPLTPRSVAGVNRRMHRRAYRHNYYGNPYAY